MCLEVARRRAGGGCRVSVVSRCFVFVWLFVSPLLLLSMANLIRLAGMCGCGAFGAGIGWTLFMGAMDMYGAVDDQELEDAIKDGTVTKRMRVENALRHCFVGLSRVVVCVLPMVYVAHLIGGINVIFYDAYTTALYHGVSSATTGLVSFAGLVVLHNNLSQLFYRGGDNVMRNKKSAEEKKEE